MVLAMESSVRSYCRSFPETLVSAKGASVFSASGRRYIDFLSGCGALNYGHNHPDLCDALLSYIASDGITMSLDLQTRSKNDFMELFANHILQPRNMEYRLQFPGPTGANAVEAAIKLARKVTGRSNVIAFTNAFHGCSLGALALTGSTHHRQSSQALLTQVTRVPYDGYWGPGVDTSAQLEQLLCDPSSGYDLPAAIVLEMIQGEGGLNIASRAWVQKLEKLALEHGILLVVDDIQAGCGRSGDFFSFDLLGIRPDIICLAKSISGFGLPMSLVLLKPEHDVWQPGEHNGTFRGNNFAFVTAAEAIRRFWSGGSFCEGLRLSARIGELGAALNCLAEAHPDDMHVEGRGMMMGLAFSDPKLAKSVQKDCFSRGLIIELCGPRDEVLKLLPPLNISAADLEQGLEVISQSVQNSLKQSSARPEVVYG